jgi:EmrB/QacA subfamily drug resistance transporter
MTTTTPAPDILFTRKSRLLIIGSTLLALFLGALDTLVMGAAMPTIVAELGGLHLYSWVFSSYLLSRAVALPVFGKLSDLFPNRRLYGITILIFLAGSVFAGLAQSMIQLTLARMVQGIGAGGNFALAYIVLADISTPESRGKMMSLASFIWGLASVLGPTFGGFVVTYFSWRWIFLVNLPLGALSLIGIILYLQDTRKKGAARKIDYLGILTLATTILALLTAFQLAGKDYPWSSLPVIGLFGLTLIGGIAFYHTEKRAEDPILSLSFFRIGGFRTGNGAAFFSSFAIFSVSAFSPLFIQGALSGTPAEVGIAMVFLSLGWSVGALFCGRMVHRFPEKPASLAGALFLIAGSAMMINFSANTSLVACSVALSLAGLGMGFVSISTLLVVQNSLDPAHLGVATSSHQFTRTLGGTIGIGVCGGIVTAGFGGSLDALAPGSIPAPVADRIRLNFENIFRPDIQALLPPDVLDILQGAIGRNMLLVFQAALIAALICFLFSSLLPGSILKRPGARTRRPA